MYTENDLPYLTRKECFNKLENYILVEIFETNDMDYSYKILAFTNTQPKEFLLFKDIPDGNIGTWLYLEYAFSSKGRRVWIKL